MISDSEFIALMNDREVLETTMKLKKDFISAEFDFIELGDDDFVALVFLAPTLGIALSNGTISLFEHLILNNKARKLSRGSYFLKKDPVLKGLEYLVEHFARWEKPFYQLIKQVLFSSLKKSPAMHELLRGEQSVTGNFQVDVLNAPYIFVKFLAFLFVEEEDDLMNERTISRIEHEKILDIAQHLSIAELPLFKEFWESFDVK